MFLIEEKLQSLFDYLSEIKDRTPDVAVEAVEAPIVLEYDWQAIGKMALQYLQMVKPTKVLDSNALYMMGERKIKDYQLFAGNRDKMMSRLFQILIVELARISLIKDSNAIPCLSFTIEKLKEIHAMSIDERANKLLNQHRLKNYENLLVTVLIISGIEAGAEVGNSDGNVYAAIMETLIEQLQQQLSKPHDPFKTMAEMLSAGRMDKN